jgi:hypothetical protein
MSPTRTRPLLLVAGAVALLGWIGLRLWDGSGHQLPSVPWSAPGVLLLLAIAVVVIGLPVRSWTRGDRDRPLDPLRAARTVVLAKAAQTGGALLVGWYLAQALALLPTADVDARRALLVRALAGVLASALVWLAGWLVERWCRVVDSDDDPPPVEASRA